MTASEKSHQNLLDYIHFLFKNRFELNKKGIIFSEKMKNSGSYTIMLTRSSKRISNPMRYTGIYNQIHFQI